MSSRNGRDGVSGSIVLVLAENEQVAVDLFRLPATSFVVLDKQSFKECGLCFPSRP